MMINTFFNIKIKTLFALIAIFSILMISMIARNIIELNSYITTLNSIQNEYLLNPTKCQDQGSRQATQSTIQTYEYKIQKSFRNIFTLLVLMVLYSFFIMFIIRQKVLRPTNYLLHVIKGFIKGEIYIKQKKIYNDEIGEMSREFFTMKDKLDHDFETIKELAQKDFLTGIYNRRTFFTEAQNSLTLMEKKKLSVSLIIIDIDYFKNINDTYGHTLGDRILIHVVKHIQTNLSTKDIFARYGGEEFIILLPNSDLYPAFDLAQKIREKIALTPYIGSSNLLRISVTLSIGVALYKYQESLEDTIKRADIALYKAKENGRNEVVIADD